MAEFEAAALEAGASALDVSKQVTPFRKYLLLSLFCASQFLDSFNVSGILAAIPKMTDELSLTQSEGVWLVSAYQLTFASFLLCSGRISDIYNTKYVFVLGAGSLGVFSLITGFIKQKIVLIVLRALAGIGAAMSIPSSLTLLVRLFPETKEKSRALSAFSCSLPIGNVSGLIIGGILVQLASWEWVFWLAAIIAIPVAVICALLIPAQPVRERGEDRLSYLDIPGVGILTASLVLLIFAFTSSGTSGWKSAMVLAPLIISIFGIGAFFFYESRIDPRKAAFPPHTWRYTNFGIIFCLALSIFMWWTSLWQEIYNWTPISAAVHFLPLGLVSGPLMLFSRRFTERFETKYVLMLAEVMLIVGTIILPFADSPSKYWSRDFPAFIVGTAGGSFLFVNANVGIFHHTPPEIAGVVGAIFNSALQLGSAVGAAFITSIQTTIDNSSTTDSTYRGRSIAFWILLGFIVADTIALVLLYKPDSQTAGPRPWEKTEQEGNPEEGVEVVEHGDARQRAIKEKKSTATISTQSPQSATMDDAPPLPTPPPVPKRSSMRISPIAPQVFYPDPDPHTEEMTQIQPAPVSPPPADNLVVPPLRAPSERGRENVPPGLESGVFIDVPLESEQPQRTEH
ncbi:MFS general substrate transporter [Exidia glandulosa HHB12029]|uniref:MFS general substrate transporter n=1 Tax=Exidia glandulosa HHB12029 TaxID=1314781 RepID=A0A165EQZ1_EXIGL|nr:MFS general substrate transporter [Exidia glandulosa HHB12029]